MEEKEKEKKDLLEGLAAVNAKIKEFEDEAYMWHASLGYLVGGHCLENEARCRSAIAQLESLKATIEARLSQFEE